MSQEIICTYCNKPGDCRPVGHDCRMICLGCAKAAPPELQKIIDLNLLKLPEFEKNMAMVIKKLAMTMMLEELLKEFKKAKADQEKSSPESEKSKTPDESVKTNFPAGTSMVAGIQIINLDKILSGDQQPETGPQQI